MAATPCKNPARLDTIRSPFDDGRAEPINSPPSDQNGRPLHASDDETLGKFMLLDALVGFGAQRMPLTATALINLAHPDRLAGLSETFIETHFAEARRSALNVLQDGENYRQAKAREKLEGREALARAAMAFDPGYCAAQEEAALSARLLNCGLCMFAAGFLACALVCAAAEALL
jgi:hypothetical protein